MKILSKNKDLFFINFPIIFPIFYGIVLYGFPEYEIYLILLTILLLAEPHFGATWPFFLQKQNNDYIKEKKNFFIIIPVIIIIFCLLGFFTFKNLFLLIFFAANIFHVTRQSVGISKLYSIEKINFKYQELFIYIFNAIFFIVGYLRFYLNSNFLESFLFEINIFFIILILLVSFFHFLKFKNFKDTLTMLSGIIIFYPTCFVNNPVHSILMGVTIHYSQYLVLTHKIVNIRSFENNLKNIKKLNLNFIITILIYSLLMTALSYMAKVDIYWLNYFLIIPITGQMLHFYLDSQLWKFSINHNRENVLKPLKLNI